MSTGFAFKVNATQGHAGNRLFVHSANQVNIADHQLSHDTQCCLSHANRAYISCLLPAFNPVSACPPLL